MPALPGTDLKVGHLQRKESDWAAQINGRRAREEGVRARVESE